MALSPRQYTRAEQRADRLLHHLGLAFAVFGVAVLLALTIRYQDRVALISVGLYAAGLLAMLVASTAANHNLSAAPGTTRVRERCDHAAIFLMIAGTYTPFTVLVLGSALGWGLLAFVWAMALLGAGLKLTGRLGYGPTIGLYLIVGWSILPALRPLLTALPFQALALLVIGGVVYTLGVLAFTATRLPFHTVIWHAMVLIAAACHYAAVLIGVVLPRSA